MALICLIGRLLCQGFQHQGVDRSVRLLDDARLDQFLSANEFGSSSISTCQRHRSVPPVSHSHPRSSLRSSRWRSSNSDGRERFTTVPLLSIMDRRASKLTTDVATLSLISSCLTRLFSVSFSHYSRRFASLILFSFSDFEQALLVEPHNVVAQIQLHLAKKKSKAKATRSR